MPTCIPDFIAAVPWSIPEIVDTSEKRDNAPWCWRLSGWL